MGKKCVIELEEHAVGLINMRGWKMKNLLLL